MAQQTSLTTNTSRGNKQQVGTTLNDAQQQVHVIQSDSTPSAQSVRSAAPQSGNEQQKGMPTVFNRPPPPSTPPPWISTASAPVAAPNSSPQGQAASTSFGASLQPSGAQLPSSAALPTITQSTVVTPSINGSAQGTSLHLSSLGSPPPYATLTFSHDSSRVPYVPQAVHTPKAGDRTKSPDARTEKSAARRSGMVAAMGTLPDPSASQASGASASGKHAGSQIRQGMVLPPLPSAPSASWAVSKLSPGFPAASSSHVPPPSDMLPVSPRQKPASQPPSDMPPVSPRRVDKTSASPLKPVPSSSSGASSSMRATAPAYRPPKELLSSVVQPDTPEAIARPCVLGEAKLNFASKTIGRENAEYGGVKVYAELTRYIQNQINGHRFSEVIAQLRAKMLSKPKEHLHHLKKVVGDASGEKGQANTVDCDYAMPLLEPVFTLICGTRQAYEDCGFPSAMKSLFLVLDRNLVKAMLEWRRGQELFLKEKLGEKLEVLKDGNGKLDDKKAKQLLASYGWIADFHHPLKSSLHNPRPFSFEYINTCRINFFTGIIFNRCISPFLAPTAAPGESRDTSAGQALIKISGAANKIFIKRYKEFAQSFVDYSNKFLHDAEAEELRGLEKKAERFEKVARSRKAVAASDKAVAPRRGHSSAPNLLQGKPFLDAMQSKAGKSAMDKSDAELAASADNRAAEREWIDEFRKKHADALRKDPALDSGFATRLRRWRKTGEQLPEAAFKKKLAELYAKAERRAAEQVNSTSERVEATVDAAEGASDASLSPRVSHTGKGTMTAQSDKAQPMLSTGRKQAEKEDVADKGVSGKKKAHRQSIRLTALIDEQAISSLNKFLQNSRRRAFTERFPGLEAALKNAYIDWLNKDTGGVATLALQDMFEDLILERFLDSMQLRQKTTDGDIEKLQRACMDWLKQPGRERPSPEELSRLWHQKVSKTPAPTYKPNTQVRVAEASIDALLGMATVRQEFDDEKLKKGFLDLVQPWLNAGAPGIDLTRIVMEFYQSAVLTHFITLQPMGNLPGIEAVKLREAMKTQTERHPDQVLTMGVLRALLDQLRMDSQQS
jgi:hypothetical protein